MKLEISIGNDLVYQRLLVALDFLQLPVCRMDNLIESDVEKYQEQRECLYEILSMKETLERFPEKYQKILSKTTCPICLCTFPQKPLH